MFGIKLRNLNFEFYFRKMKNQFLYFTKYDDDDEKKKDKEEVDDEKIKLFNVEMYQLSNLKRLRNFKLKLISQSGCFLLSMDNEKLLEFGLDMKGNFIWNYPHVNNYPAHCVAQTKKMYSLFYRWYSI